MNNTKLEILWVDDNPQFVERMISLLGENNEAISLQVAGSCEEAWNYLVHALPDLVLLDINLPDKSGIELLGMINASGMSCPVIVISNHDNEFYRKKCEELGAIHFLDKSSDFGLLPILIEQIARS